MSLKLKFQLAIVLMISVVTVVTVQITKSIYTADKLTSVYEKATLEQESLKNQIFFLRELAEAKALRYTELFLNKNLKKEALFQQFNRDPLLVALGVKDKKKDIFSFFRDNEESIISKCSSRTYRNLICHDFKSNDLELRIAFDVSEVKRKLSEIADLKTFLIMQGQLPKDMPGEIVETIDFNTNGVSTYQTETFLVTSLKSQTLGFQLVSVMEKSRAFAEITELTRKIFLAALIIGTSCLIFGIILANGLTGKLKELADYALRIAVGDFSQDFQVTGKDEVSALGNAFGKMRKDLVYYIDEQKTKVRMQHELEVAQVVQRSFFGAPRVSGPHIRMINQIHPTSECGGDWCFVENLKHGTLFGIGDATGHGAGAALTTAAIYSGVKILISQLREREVSEADLIEAIKTLNLVLSMPQQGQLMTFVLAYAPNSGEELLLINQGHHPPLLLNVVTKKVTVLPLSPSNRLGEANEISPQVQRAPFKKGEICLLITDGLIELKKSEKMNFNRNKLIRELGKDSPANAEALAQFLEAKIQVIKDYGLNNDDICYVIAEKV